MSSPLKQNTTTIQELLTKINNLPEATEQVAPTISVNASGLITATAGTKSSTHQLAFQAAKTITPTTANKIAVSSGYFTVGNVTVQGDSNLIADNIKSGISIFGVSGTYEGSSGSSEQAEWSDNEDAIISGTISGHYVNDRATNIKVYAFYSCSSLTTVSFPACTTIGSYAFANCYRLTTVSFPACTTIGSNAFYNCSKLTSASFPVCKSIYIDTFRYCKLTSASFPVCTTIGSYAFYSCSSLTTVSFPACTTIGSYAFANCYRLTTVSFPACTTIGGSAFANCSRLTTVSFPACTTIGGSAFIKCYNLKSLYLTGSSLCKLSHSNAFSSTPIGGYSTSAGTYGSIYVPTSLLTSYKTATNWTYFSSRFVGI